ncbi:sensor histidine kinase [Microbacterium sp. NPDC012755]|uniref:sensor histidine kinase n=1 Tax=Microbacterium sp. NPDC012755 TaxID=3364184 RepID=UPI0036BE9B93
MHSEQVGSGSLGTRVGTELRTFIPLGIVERWALVAFVCAAVVVSVAVAALDGFERPGTLGLEILLSLAFLLALWNATAVPIALLILVACSSPLTGSSLIESEQQALLALAISGGVVVRCCTTIVQVLFALAFLVGIAVVYSSAESASSTASLVVLVLVAAGSALLGAVLRLQVTRGMRTRAALTEERLRSSRIVQDERQRIADDLHDVVAHDLTGIAMHAQLLARTADEEERRRSQDAILAASRQALTDLRRVVNVVHTERPEAVGAIPGYDIAGAIDALRHELVAAGYEVRVDVRAGITGTSRLTVSAIERILREAGTNIIKHAHPPQLVSIEVRRDEDVLRLRVWNSMTISAARAARLPGSGYGTMRMQERTQLLGGRFIARPDGDGWLLDAALPDA